MPRRASLRGQLLLWLLVPLGILWPVGGTVAYFVAKGFASSAYDRFLLDSTRALAAQSPTQQSTSEQGEHRHGRHRNDDRSSSDVRPGNVRTYRHCHGQQAGSLHHPTELTGPVTDVT